MSDPPQRRGRPARLDLPRTTVELDPPTKARLVAAARARRATLGEVIAEAVRRMLDGEAIGAGEERAA